jgi:uncharacterized protein YjiS (DUF1127 family)
MNANLSAPIGAQSLTGQVWARQLIAALKRLWAAYLNWRIEHQAIAHLRSMSAAQLKDIGLVRWQIGFAVCVGIDPEQPRTVRPFPVR